MPLDPSIPLQVHQYPLEDPIAVYGRMLSLRHLQAQEQDRRRLAPIQYQHAQLALQEQQRLVSDHKKAAEIYREVYGADTAPAAAPAAAPPAATPAAVKPATSLQSSAAPGYSVPDYDEELANRTAPADQPAAAPQSSTAPAGGGSASQPAPAAKSGAMFPELQTPVPMATEGISDTVQPATSLQSSTGEQPAAPPAEPTAAAAATAPPPEPTAAAATVQPATSLQNSTAPPAASPAAAPPVKADDVFARKMAAAGLGEHVPAILHQRAVTKEAQLRVEKMQPDQNDQEAWGIAYNKAGGDPEKTLSIAAENGMSQAGIATARQNLQKMVLANIKARAALTTAQVKEEGLRTARADRVAERMQAFLKRPDDESEGGMTKNWQSFVDGLYRDGYSTSAEHDAVMKAFPKFPGREQVEGLVAEHASAKWVKQQADTLTAQAAATKAQQQQIATKLTAAATNGTQADFDRILKENKVPAGTYPAAFDASGKRIPGAAAAIDRIGMTPAERTAADERAVRDRETAARDRDTERHRKVLEDAATNKKAKETASEHKQAISRLADQAIAESTQSGGGKLDDAIANVDNPNFYQGHPIGDARGEVSKELLARKTGKAREAATESATAKKNEISGLEKIRFMRDHPGEPIPSKAEYQKSLAKPKTTPAAAPPKGTAPPAAATPPPAAPAAPPTAPAAPPANAPATAPKQPVIPPAAKAVHDALRTHRVPFNMVDGSDGLPIIEKDGKQYKVLGIGKDGSLKLLPGTFQRQ